MSSDKKAERSIVRESICNKCGLAIATNQFWDEWFHVETTGSDSAAGGFIASEVTACPQGGQHESCPTR